MTKSSGKPGTVVKGIHTHNETSLTFTRSGKIPYALRCETMEVGAKKNKVRDIEEGEQQ